MPFVTIDIYGNIINNSAKRAPWASYNTLVMMEYPLHNEKGSDYWLPIPVRTFRR